MNNHKIIIFKKASTKLLTQSKTTIINGEKKENGKYLKKIQLETLISFVSNYKDRLNLCVILFINCLLMHFGFAQILDLDYGEVLDTNYNIKSINFNNLNSELLCFDYLSIYCISN